MAEVAAVPLGPHVVLCFFTEFLKNTAVGDVNENYIEWQRSRKSENREAHILYIIFSLYFYQV